MKKLSIIVPVYNTEKYVERCILSCENQIDINKEAYEIIIVNDGSTDNSLSVINRLHDMFSNIKLINQKNQGLSGARNTGLKASEGEYIWYVDSDDWIDIRSVSLIIDNCLSNDLDIFDICAADITENNDTVRRFSITDERIVQGKEKLKNRCFAPCAPFSIYKRTFLIDNNLYFYPGILHEDSEFKPKAYYLANRVKGTNEICYYVYPTFGSISRTVNPKRASDLLIVMESLHKFSQNMVKDDIIPFHNFISLLYNSMLDNTLKMDNSTSKDFEQLINEHLHLLNHLQQSEYGKYHLEYYLFSMFPRYIISINRFLQYINTLMK